MCYWYTDNMKRIHAMNGHVTIKPDVPEETTKSGIFLVEQLGSYPPTGTVVDSPWEDVKEGDRVVYSVYESVDFDKDLVIIPLSGIYGVLTDES